MSVSKVRIVRVNGVVVSEQPATAPKTCPHRGEQVETIICDQCGQGKGQPKPVYSCALHGLCTHRLERRGQESQDPPIRTCIGCPDGPWAA